MPSGERSVSIGADPPKKQRSTQASGGNSQAQGHRERRSERRSFSPSIAPRYWRFHESRRLGCRRRRHGISMVFAPVRPRSYGYRPTTVRGHGNIVCQRWTDFGQSCRAVGQPRSASKNSQMALARGCAALVQNARRCLAMAVERQVLARVFTAANGP